MFPMLEMTPRCVTWVVVVLVGLSASADGSSDSNFVLHVTDGQSFNNGTTVNASTALIGNTATWKRFSAWAAAGITKNSSTQYFSGTIIDGRLWMPPYRDGDTLPLVSMDIETGAMKKYSWPSGFITGNEPFHSGGAYDGLQLWLVPWEANQVLKVNPTTGSMTGYACNYNGYLGTSLDRHGFLWMTPFRSAGSNGVRRMDTSSGAMVDFTNGPASFAWSTGGHPVRGGCFDGTYHWMVPYSGAWVVGVNTDVPSSQMTGFRISGWSSKGIGLSSMYQFTTAAITEAGSQAIWLIPVKSDSSIVHLNTSTGTVTGYNNWPSDFTPAATSDSWMFTSGLFDGKSIWLCPNAVTTIVRFDPTTGAMSAFTPPSSMVGTTSYVHGGFGGIALDASTRALYLMPRQAEMVLRLTTSGAQDSTPSSASSAEISETAGPPLGPKESAGWSESANRDSSESFAENSGPSLDETQPPSMWPPTPRDRRTSSPVVATPSPTSAAATSTAKGSDHVNTPPSSPTTRAPTPAATVAAVVDPGASTGSGFSILGRSGTAAIVLLVWILLGVFVVIIVVACCVRRCILKRKKKRSRIVGVLASDVQYTAQPPARTHRDFSDFGDAELGDVGRPDGQSQQRETVYTT